MAIRYHSHIGNPGLGYAGSACVEASMRHATAKFSGHPNTIGRIGGAIGPKPMPHTPNAISGTNGATITTPNSAKAQIHLPVRQNAMEVDAATRQMARLGT